MEKLTQSLLYVIEVPVWYLIGMLLSLSIPIIVLIRMWGRRVLEISVLEYELRKQTERTKDVLKASQNQERLIMKKENLLVAAQEQLRQYRQAERPVSLEEAGELAKKRAVDKDYITAVTKSRIGAKIPNGKPRKNPLSRPDGQ